MVITVTAVTLLSAPGTPAPWPGNPFPPAERAVECRFERVLGLVVIAPRRPPKGLHPMDGAGCLAIHSNPEMPKSPPSAPRFSI